MNPREGISVLVENIISIHKKEKNASSMDASCKAKNPVSTQQTLGLKAKLPMNRKQVFKPVFRSSAYMLSQEKKTKGKVYI